MQYLTVQYLLAMESLKLLIMNLNILVAVTSNFFNPYWYVTRMEDGRIPKDMLYSELCLGTRPTGRPELRFKDVCKRDMKACDIDTSSWETAAHNRTTWRKITHDGMKKNDKKRHHKWQEKRNKPPPQPPADPARKCNNCNKVCGSRIGLHSHRIRCIQK